MASEIPINRRMTCSFRIASAWETIIVCWESPTSAGDKIQGSTMQKTNFFQLSDLENQRTQSAKLYREFLRVPAMSAGVYVLHAGASDPQSPHKEDEMYYVVRGKARMRVGAEDRAVTQGSVIFVAAGVEHRFYEIEEELVGLLGSSERSVEPTRLCRGGGGIHLHCGGSARARHRQSFAPIPD
jgi:quercetin dioxygenase-like cupin family protein